jgi:hypothetical protein
MCARASGRELPVVVSAVKWSTSSCRVNAKQPWRPPCHSSCVPDAARAVPPLGPTTAEQLLASLSTHRFRQLGLWWPPRRLVVVRLGLRRGQAPACRLDASGPGRVLAVTPQRDPGRRLHRRQRSGPGPLLPGKPRRRAPWIPEHGPRPAGPGQGPGSSAPAGPVDLAWTGHR